MVVHSWIPPFAETAAGLVPLTSGRMSPPLRELALRVSGTDEVLLLWDPESDGVSLSVRNSESGAGFHIEVEPGRALEAFYHPHAYVARRGNSDRAGRAVATGLRT